MICGAETQITTTKVTMDYRTFTFELDRDAAGVVIEVASLYARLETLTDTRRCPGLRYPLALILVALVLGKLAGEDKPEGIAAWAQWRHELFRQAFGLNQPRMPHANTYRRILQTIVRVDELAAVVDGFLAELPEAHSAQHYALHGTFGLRGSRTSGERAGLHLLAVYVPGSGLTLRQLAVPEETNEIPVAQYALQSLDLQGKLVTGDALHTQRETSALIVAAGGDYVWLAKDNQVRLAEDIAQLFAPEVYVPGFSPGPSDFRTVQQVNKGHGRIEKRRLTVSSRLAESSDWPGLAQGFQLERLITDLHGEVLRDEVVYGLTSLTASEASPRQLLTLQRRHWAIESELHYRRDVSLGEDACRCKHHPMAQALAILNNLVIALLLRQRNANLPRAQRYYNAHPDHALNLLFRAPARL
jgi:predicted transposase YbfD/YdcC